MGLSGLKVFWQFLNRSLLVWLFSVWLWANFLIHLLSLLWWPAPPTIHRGLEWPQCLNCSLSVCLSACSLSVLCLSSNFLILLLILLYYSSVSSVIYWPALPTIHRGLEWPQCLNCSLSVCLIVLCLWANFLILLLILLWIKYWPAFPEMTLGDKVASVFELFSVCLIVLCLSVCKFSNFSSPHPPLL